MSITNKQIGTLFDGEHECGVHTLQVSHIHWLKTIPKIVTYRGLQNGVHQYKLSPSKEVHKNSYTLVDSEKMPAVFRDLVENNEVRVERVDFAFDNYTRDYMSLYALNSVLLQLFALKCGLSNNGLTKQIPLDGDSIKDLFVKFSGYGSTDRCKFEASYYKKTLQYPNCGINGRLELRCLDAGGTVQAGIQRIISLLTHTCKADNYNALVEHLTNVLLERWRRDVVSRGMPESHWKTWLQYNRECIVSSEQLHALIRELRGDIDVVQAIADYNSSRPDEERLTRDNLVSFSKLKKYVRRLKKCLYLYLENYQYAQDNLPPYVPKPNKNKLKAAVTEKIANKDDPFADEPPFSAGLSA